MALQHEVGAGEVCWSQWLFGLRVEDVKKAEALLPVLMARLLSLSSRRTVKIHGLPLQLANYFFDTPVQQEIRIPRRADLTGLKVWPTALRILDELSESILPQMRERAAARRRPLRVLELGSGTGVLGLGVALIGGPSHVVLTDPNLPVNFTETESGSSLEWLQVNVDLNRAAFQHAGAQVEARELEWTSDEHVESVRLACLPDDADAFDLVLGSEILYDPDQYDPLLKTLNQLARAEDTLTVLGYTIRHGAEARFLEKAKSSFSCVETRRFERGEAGSAWELTMISHQTKADNE